MDEIERGGKKKMETTKEMKKNKYLYGWKLYSNYGNGWEYQNFYTDRKKLLIDKKNYKENSPYPIKITYGRELND